jgi:phage recombination protein Bet
MRESRLKQNKEVRIMSTVRTIVSATPAKELSREKVELIKNTVARGATDDELALFLHRARQLGFDPLSGQIHFVKRKVWSPAEDKYVDVGTILIGIEGFRLIAERSGNYDGQDPIIFIVKREGNIIETEYALPNDEPIAARAAIYKKGCPRPFVAVAHYSDYVQKVNGQPTKMWQKWPIMLGKCAEAAAFRKGFPEMNLSGVYEYAEIQQEAQAEAEVQAEAKPLPSPGEDVKPLPKPEPAPAPTTAPETPAPAKATEKAEKPAQLPTKQQLQAIRAAAKKLGITDDVVENVVAALDFQRAGEVIRRLNKKDTSDFVEQPAVTEAVEDIPDLVTVEEEI